MVSCKLPFKEVQCLTPSLFAPSFAITDVEVIDIPSMLKNETKVVVG